MIQFEPTAVEWQDDDGTVYRRVFRGSSVVDIPVSENGEP